MTKVLPFPPASPASPGADRSLQARGFSTSALDQNPQGGDSDTSPLSQNRENPPFIDWLSIYQDHPESLLPVVGKEYLIRSDVDSGEIVSSTVTNYRHEGSFDSALLVRCDGSRVSVSGNPSRFNRPDSLVGYADLRACVSVYNRVLDALGLPGFYNTGHRYDFGDGTVKAKRAVVTRVDITRNYQVGPGNVIPFISWLATQKHQRDSGHVYSNGRTVDWNRGSRRTYIKYYDKANELKRQKNPSEYLQKLIGYCESRGVVRHELSLKSNQLKSLGLDNLLNWKPQTMGELLDKYTFHARVSGTRNSLHDIANTLQELGYNSSLSMRCQMIAISWASGVAYVPDDNISKSAFYRLRKPLLSIGIDIAVPANVATLPISIREIKVMPFELPDWYPQNLEENLSARMGTSETINS